MSKQTTLHPLKAKVFAKGQALREARTLIDALVDLKSKVEATALEAGMDSTELWAWLVDQLEINATPEDDFYPSNEEDEEEEGSEEGAAE